MNFAPYMDDYRPFDLDLNHRYGPSARTPDWGVPDTHASALPRTPRLGAFRKDSGRNLHTAASSSPERIRVRLPGGQISPNPERPQPFERVPTAGTFPGFATLTYRPTTQSRPRPSARPFPSPWGTPEARPATTASRQQQLSSINRMCITRAFDPLVTRKGFDPPMQHLKLGEVGRPKARLGMDLAGAPSLMSLGRLT